MLSEEDKQAMLDTFAYGKELIELVNKGCNAEGCGPCDENLETLRAYVIGGLREITHTHLVAVAETLISCAETQLKIILAEHN